MAQAQQVLLVGQSEQLRLHRGNAEVPAPAAWLPDLSPRDLSVLRLLADGASTATIADDLAYSESTIKNVVRDLVHRIGARNRAHAVALAIRAGAI